MDVLKFGGTSVGSAENMLRVKNIVENRKAPLVVVVSAVGGITDKLISASKLAETGNNECFEVLKTIQTTHFNIIETLFGTNNNLKLQVKTAVDSILQELDTIIRGVFLIKELTPRSYECISAFGERMSSVIIANLITGASLYDSREYIKTERQFGKNGVNSELTNSLLKSVKPSLSAISVWPGFISSNKDNETTTLGRGGSDYTAAILAAAFDADILEIWTDVDGFMTADPRVIPNAYCIDRLSYSEAMELSHFGAKVIYPPTILPVYDKNITIKIKNTFNPDAPGTLIDNQTSIDPDKKIKGISSISKVSLLTVQGIGMVGVTGISMRLFKSLAREEINIILISQASSENSISIVIESACVEAAQRLIATEFASEIAQKQINNITIENEMSVVAIVGENMKHTTGVAGKLFQSVGKNGVNIFAIAQGASELNISFVVKEKDLKKALNVIHESFFLSDSTVVNLFLVGLGTVGGKLISQLQSQSKILFETNKLSIKIIGIAKSKKNLCKVDGIPMDKVADYLANEGEDATIDVFVKKAIELNLSNSVFVDCTASDVVAKHYYDLLKSNISVVTANKIASSSEYVNYKKLKETARQKGVRFLFETNVGAGLPIIAPLNDLVKSGDRIIKLEAVLSGTLNFVLNAVSADKKLSVVIKEAMEKGYSEPDPRIDLSGTDVMRKLLILSREAGFVMEKEDISVDALLPQKYMAGNSVAEFLKLVEDYDVEFEAKRKVLESKGLKWRYAARLDNGKATVGLVEVDANHAFANLEGSNNIVLFTTERYREHPMQIKGYGAGADVTAAGVFADIIKAANI